MPLGYLSPNAFRAGMSEDPMAEADPNVVPPMQFMNPNAPIVNNQRQYSNLPSGQIIDPKQFMQDKFGQNQQQLLIQMLMGTSGLPGS